MSQNSKKKMIIFISGRGSNMQHLIQECQSGILKNHAEVVSVFSNKACAQGIQTAQKLEVPTHIIESDNYNNQDFSKELSNYLNTLKFDYIILAGYMKVLPSQITIPHKNRIINIHPADTRQHQGLHAYEWAFSQGLTQTHITIHYVDAGIDTGPIIAQKPVDLQGAKTLEEVTQRGLAVEHSFYSQTLKNLFLGAN